MSQVDCLPSIDTKQQKLHTTKTERLVCADCDENDPYELKLLILSLKHKKISRFLEIVIVFLNIVGCIYCITGKSMLYYQVEHFKNDVVMFVNCSSDILLVVLIIFGIMGSTRCTFMVEIFNFITKQNFLVKKEPKTFSICMKILRIGPIVPICLEVYFFGFNIGWSIYQYFLPRAIWFYGCNLMMCSFVSFANKIKLNFKAINDNLEDVITNSSITEQKVMYITEETDLLNYPTDKYGYDHKKIIDFSNRYNHLCNLLDKFNRSVKAFIVMAILCNTVNILYNCTVFIEFGAKPKVINGTETKIYVLLVQTMLALTTVGQVAVGAFVGESLQDEGHRTSSICYTLLNKLNKEFKTENGHLIKNELNFLLDLSKSRRICLDAGGFFQLNWGILGSVTSTVATYTIVIIQFLLK